ncbi:ABC transporter ATP-binding protein [Azospirillum sp. RWY-5-1]|uniref:ABC transporter ATP-binding protein n=1 Tax=Azospirillum oleiclasticum TaxID=2735135 RepID=A0ABX2TIW4_9PROT|nr:ABC transporter ATP-binding protein [Azospirillum oleiclasticum]NYZ16134.1 ABC transporter ATP-binding protein [Azospirillum oleiclasticum]NYZ23014.1 ABC transporter ATP-binding protein [Azospirillum oleiclasticum]
MTAVASPAIACEGVTVAFGDFVALRNVSLAFAPGRLAALIGPNGAGKTTLINVLSGQIRPTAGRVLLGGRDVTRLAPHARARTGLGRSFQIVTIFPEMTVMENLRLGAQARAFGLQPFWRAVDGWRALRERAEACAETVGLAAKLHSPAGSLSHGEQRALELGLTLTTDPAVLLLDEPLAGVGHSEIDRSVALIERVRQGRTVLLIEHNMDVVMSISDEVVVMTGGELLARGTPAEMRADARVRAGYLGDRQPAGQPMGRTAYA